MPPMKAKRDALYTKLWARPLGYYTAWILLNTNITPNMISIVAVFDSIIACVLMSMNNYICMIIGIIMLNLFLVLDCVDGIMARTLKKNSYMGEFFDALGGYTMCAFPLLAISICAYNSGRTLFLTQAFPLLLFGSLGCITDIFSRLIYQKYTANEMISNSKRGREITRENDAFYEDINKLSITYLRLAIDREFGIGGCFAGIVAVGFIFNFLDIVVLGYSLYHILGFFAVLYIFACKASMYDKGT